MGKLTLLQHLQTCAETVRTYLDGKIAELAGTTVDALEEIGRVKAAKPQAVSFLLPAQGWEQEQETSAYPLYFDVQAAVTEADRVLVSLSPGGMETAKACSLCPTCESGDGTIRFRAVRVPAAEIAAVYWVDQGKE